ncbi:MAG: AAA family ATPase [Acidimicrobiales bacterium]
MDAGEGEIVLVENADGQLMIPIHDPGDESGDVAAPPPHTSALPPRLRRVWMRNFKGFASFDVSLGTFNVLAGANNAGKSTLLQGVDLLYALMKLHAEGNHLAPRGRLVPAAILPVASPRDLFFRQNWRRGNVYVEAVVGAEFS